MKNRFLLIDLLNRIVYHEFKIIFYMEVSLRMNETRKKRYIVIFFFLIVIVLCAYFMISGKLTESRKLADERNTDNITYAQFKEGQQEAMNEADKEKVKQADLERSLQEVIQSIVEGSDSLVSIHDFNSADFSASAVSVTLYTEQGNDISQEQRDGIVRTIAGSMDGLAQDNITINISAPEA